MNWVSDILQNPENNLPSFHWNSFTKLETTMQENLFEILNNSHSKRNTIPQNITFEFEKFNNLESIYALNSFYYIHDSNVIENTPKISMIAKFHYALISAVKYWCKIHRISIISRLGLTQNSKDNLDWHNNDLVENQQIIRGAFNYNELHWKTNSNIKARQHKQTYTSKSGEFLYEYAVRWTAFTNSIWKLSTLLSNFEQRLSESYEDSWPQGSSKFHTFRLLTRIWGKEVLTSELINYLKEMFTLWIQEYHKDMIQHIRDKTVLKDNASMKIVLKIFFQALVDGSINEKTVHFIDNSDVEFDRLYKTFEAILIWETTSFIKNALEVGYKANNLKQVYSIFESHSETVKGFLTQRTLKLFEKAKTEVIVKFVRFLIWSRLKQFENFDVSKIKSKWSPHYDSAIDKIFTGKDSVFLKKFYKAVEEKNIDSTLFK